MVNTSIVNKFGNMAGWTSVTLRLLGRDVVGVTSIEYDDVMEKENIFGAGNYPVGQGKGNYSAKASMTLLQEERVNLLDSLPNNTRIQDVESFDIVISFDYKGRVYKDVIRNCQFTNNGTAVNQGDKSISYKYDLICSHIDYNV